MPRIHTRRVPAQVVECQTFRDQPDPRRIRNSVSAMHHSALAEQAVATSRDSPNPQPIASSPANRPSPPSARSATPNTPTDVRARPRAEPMTADQETGRATARPRQPDGPEIYAADLHEASQREVYTNLGDPFTPHGRTSRVGVSIGWHIAEAAGGSCRRRVSLCSGREERREGDSARLRHCL